MTVLDAVVAFGARTPEWPRSHQTILPIRHAVITNRTRPDLHGARYSASNEVPSGKTHGLKTLARPEALPEMIAEPNSGSGVEMLPEDKSAGVIREQRRCRRTPEGFVTLRQEFATTEFPRDVRDAWRIMNFVACLHCSLCFTAIIMLILSAATNDLAAGDCARNASVALPTILFALASIA